MTMARKNIIFYSLMILVYFMAIFFPGIDMVGKKYILGTACLVLFIFTCFAYDWPWLKSQVIKVFIPTVTQPLRLYSEAISRIAWFIFLLAMLALNFEWVWASRGLLAVFLLMVVLCAILTFFELKQSNSLASQALQFFFGVATPLIYVVSTTYIASYFLKSSGLKIDESPLIQLWLGWTWFAVWMLFVIQLFSIAFYFTQLKNMSTGYLLNLSAILIGGTFLVLLATGWFTKFQVLILDYATNKEWSNTFSCHNKNYNYGRERYFQQDDDKYISYFSDREGKWGFAKIRCGENSTGITRQVTSSIDMPKWFSDK